MEVNLKEFTNSYRLNNTIDDSLVTTNKYTNTVIVPLRGGSKGLKDKNIKYCLGFPLYYWTIKKLYILMLMGKVDTIIISSDNDWYLSRVKADFGFLSGIKLCLSKRPDHLSDDSSTTDDVVLHELNKFSIYSGIVSIVEVTSPLIPVDALNLMMSTVDDFIDSSFIVCEDIGQFWKCKKPEYKWEAQYKQRYMRQMESVPLFKEVGAWSTNVEKFRESKDRISGTVSPIIVDTTSGISINNEDDFVYAEYLMRKNSPQIFKEIGLYK